MRTMVSLTYLISKDMATVKVRMPGRKLTKTDRFGDGPHFLHQRIQHGEAIMRGHLSADVVAQDHDYDYRAWKHIFMLEMEAATTEELVHLRQLALDLGASDAYELFPDEILPGPESALPEFKYPSSQLRAFLAAKELLGQLLSDKMCE